MISNKVIPVILCGGSGTRLWPLSRKSFPKQYLKLNSQNNNSLIQNTYRRISSVDGMQNPILICNEEHRFIAAEQMREINVNPSKILLEPFGRNTAPAITLATLVSLDMEDDPLLLVLSSDHEIKNNKKFTEAINIGLNYANDDKLVTFGVVPRSPETGYGYIKSEHPFNLTEITGNKISEFTEKPNYENACEFIKDKRYTWNSGMFLFKASVIKKELEKFYPKLVESCKNSLDKSENDLDFQRLNKNYFEQCENISFDIAIMEKTNKGVVIPLDAGWSDIGSWESIWETSQKDENNNFIKGNVLIENTNNSYIRSNHRLIVGIGIENLVVIETDDAILISNKGQSQKVKNILNILREKQINAADQHQKIYRPWGHYLSIIEKSRWQVKLIFVKPGEKLSLQLHHHRSEHWVVVSGTAKIEIDKNEKIITENQSVYIPLGSKHRLMNPGKIPLSLIEVQSGSYVGEDDILRFEDKYGRSN